VSGEKVEQLYVIMNVEYNTSVYANGVGKGQWPLAFYASLLDAKVALDVMAVAFPWSREIRRATVTITPLEDQ
jgi:hypothetical protein